MRSPGATTVPFVVIAPARMPASCLGSPNSLELQEGRVNSCAALGGSFGAHKSRAVPAGWGCRRVAARLTLTHATRWRILRLAHNFERNAGKRGLGKDGQ